MHQVAVKIAGNGVRVEESVSHPPGILFSGGFDAEKRELYLSSVMGHPRGVAAAGGEPAGPMVSGLRLLIVDKGEVYWATDSMSLPRGLSDTESRMVQQALERHFGGKVVRRVDKLEEIPR